MLALISFMIFNLEQRKSATLVAIRAFDLSRLINFPKLGLEQTFLELGSLLLTVGAFSASNEPLLDALLAKNCALAPTTNHGYPYWCRYVLTNHAKGERKNSKRFQLFPVDDPILHELVLIFVYDSCTLLKGHNLLFLQLFACL